MVSGYRSGIEGGVKTGMKKELAHYVSLPYTLLVHPIKDESGEYFVGCVLELDGCMSDGDTLEEAYENTQEAMEGYLEVKLAYGDPIPRPIKEKDMLNGNANIYLPETLQQRLTVEAKKEGVSLNQYILRKLSE